MPRVRSYTDEQLKAAVQDNHSWRGVLRELGLVATSSSSIRSVRRHADALGCDYAHFRGQRSWTEQELCAAVAAASVGGMSSTPSAWLAARANRPHEDTSQGWASTLPIWSHPSLNPRATGMHTLPARGTSHVPDRYWPLGGSLSVGITSRGRWSRAGTT